MDRVLLTLGTLAFAGVVYALMLKGWRSRQRRQDDVPAPPVATPGAAVLAGPFKGLYVGTTGAEHWMDRIAVHRLSDRATGTATVAADGLHLVRHDLPEVFVPVSLATTVTIEQALAGKVVSTGMLTVTWHLGDRLVTTAFRADDPDHHALLLDALTALLPVETT